MPLNAPHSLAENTITDTTISINWDYTHSADHVPTPVGAQFIILSSDPTYELVIPTSLISWPTTKGLLMGVSTEPTLNDQYIGPKTIDGATCTYFSDGPHRELSHAVTHGAASTGYFYSETIDAWEVMDEYTWLTETSGNPASWEVQPTPPPCTIGVPYVYNLGALIGGDRPITLIESGTGALPNGLNLLAGAGNENNERIEGIPEEAGTFDNLELTIDNAEASPQVSDSFTLIGNPIIVSAPNTTSVTKTEATVSGAINTTAATLYFAIREDGPWSDGNATHEDEIVNGGAFVVWTGSVMQPALGANSMLADGLAIGTVYYLGLFAKDVHGNTSNIVNTEFITESQELIMTATIPNEGEKLMANLICKNADVSRGTDLEVILFTTASDSAIANDAETITFASLSQPNGQPGYDPITIPDGDWSDDGANGLVASPVTFAATNSWTGIEISGWAVVTKGTPQVVLMYEKDTHTDAPYSFTTNDTYQVTPYFSVE